MSQPPRHRFRCRAVVAVLALASITVLLSIAALTIDVGYLYNTRADLQRAVDAAALAGASGLSISANEVRIRARAYAAINRAAGTPVLLGRTDIEVGRWDRQTRSLVPLGLGDQSLPDACRVTAKRTTRTGNPVNLFFAHLFGKATANVSAVATAQFGTAQTWDVMIVQDNSTSFTGTLERAKEANRALVECLKDHIDNESQVGFVAYTGDARAIVPLQPLATGFDQVIGAIDDLSPCCLIFCRGGLRCNTGTNIAAGIDAAIDQLVNSRSNPDIGKAIVLVSDGKPQATVFVRQTDEELHDMAIAAADDAAAAGISIFTVYYAGSSATPQEDATFLAGLTKGRGTFQQTPDASELSGLVWKICASLPLMLVE